MTQSQPDCLLSSLSSLASPATSPRQSSSVQSSDGIERNSAATGQLYWTICCSKNISMLCGLKYVDIWDVKDRKWWWSELILSILFRLSYWTPLSLIGVGIDLSRKLSVFSGYCFFSQSETGENWDNWEILLLFKPHISLLQLSIQTIHSHTVSICLSLNPFKQSSFTLSTQINN